jgi:hypothetical protein
MITSNELEKYNRKSYQFWDYPHHSLDGLKWTPNPQSENLSSGWDSKRRSPEYFKAVPHFRHHVLKQLCLPPPRCWTLRKGKHALN